MARPVKCAWCETQEDDREKVVKSEYNNRYFHIDMCYNKHVAEVEFKKKERVSREKLIETIVEIHGLDSHQMIPTSFYPFIEEVRNDSQLFGKLKRNYKNGIKYEALDYTYKFCKEKIEWAKGNKEFKNALSELKYGLAIVKNNVADAQKHYTDQKRREKMREENLSETKEIVNYHSDTQENVSVKKKKRDNLDISHLL